MGKIGQGDVGFFESDLLSDQELMNLQGTIFRGVDTKYNYLGQLESLYVHIIKLGDMVFFKDYNNHFDGYWVQVQVLAEPHPEPLARYYILIAVLTDDGWYVEFPWGEMNAHPYDSLIY